MNRFLAVPALLAVGIAAAPRIATLLVIVLTSHRFPNSTSSAYDQRVCDHDPAGSHYDWVDVDLIDDISQVACELRQPADGIDQPVDLYAGIAAKPRQ